MSIRGRRSKVTDLAEKFRNNAWKGFCIFARAVVSNVFFNTNKVITKLIKTLTHFCSKCYKLRVIFLIEIIQGPQVFAVTNKPVDGGKVLPLSQFLVQTPKYLHHR